MKKLLLIIFSISVYSVVFAQSGHHLFDDVDYLITPLSGINTVGSDISPFFVGEELFFSSIRDSYFNKESLERKNIAFYDIYSVPLNKEGLVTSARSLVSGFGAKYHEGPASYCSATGELFVTLSNVINPDTIRRVISKKDIKLRIVIMKKEGDYWRISQEMPFNDKNYSFAHPAINKTGDTLVFVSNMEGTLGQNDLFMSVRNGNNWSTPENLGDKINTAGNEMFPTFIKNGLLAFSSDIREGGHGGLDIYYASFPDIREIWNMGDKINSTLDDFGFVLHSDEKIGYFSSNRGDTGSDDIFMVNLTNTYFSLKGLVINEYANKSLSDADVVLSDCDGNQLASTTSDKEGTFSFKVKKGTCINVCGSKIGYSKDCESVEDKIYVELRLSPHLLLFLDASTKEPVSNTNVYCGNNQFGTSDFNGIFCLSQELSNDCDYMAKVNGYLDQYFNPNNTNLVDTIWMYKRELNKSFVLEDIYYDFDKWDILPESKIELNKLVRIMHDNPEIKVELGSHTDSRGSDRYNKWLSQKRSNSAVDYIISKNIEKERIVAKGYGETKLINRCGNGVKCSETEHRKNRRTEFKLIGL